MSKKKGGAAPQQQQTAVAVAAKTEVATKAVGSFKSHAGKGLENMGSDDLAIPFLTVLQALSPEVKRSEGAYIEGAIEGMVLNTVTKQVIDTEKVKLYVVPCVYKRSFVEWRVREKGGGFVNEYHTAPNLPTVRDDKSREILPNGNQLNDTRAFYVMVQMDDGPLLPAVLAMTSTQIKKAKQWNMQMDMLRLTDESDGTSYKPPIYATRWLVETVPESNEKGSWYGWKFTHDGYFDGEEDPRFVEASNFAKAIMSGAAAADMRNSTTEGRAVDPDTGELVDGKGGAF